MKKYIYTYKYLYYTTGELKSPHDTFKMKHILRYCINAIWLYNYIVIFYHTKGERLHILH
jgi:hypothetical protein